jgi:hypothetical protein
MSNDLLPTNATAFERAFSLAVDALDRLSPGIGAIKTAKLVTLPDNFLPFLIYEYGLGEVSAYVADQRRLLSIGRDWQRVRGTPEALALALDWLNYDAILEEAPARRRRWNLFQLALRRIRDFEEPDLENIEGVAGLSVAVRSQFWRGYNGYDVRELEWSRKPWSGAIWSAASGVRLRSDGAKWSFGRSHDFQVFAGQSFLDPLDAWVPPSGSDLGWGDFTWLDAGGASWVDVDAQARINLIIGALTGRPIFAAFRDAGGEIIGYRRARAIHPVRVSPGGEYAVGGLNLTRDATTPTGLYVEAMTGFGDGAGATAESVTLVWDAVPDDPEKPGLLWGGPDEITGGTGTSPVAETIAFGQTVRERVRFYLTF